MSINAVDLETVIAQAIADGINRAADTAFADIYTHVAVRTGRLQHSYQILKVATPESQSATIGSPVEYRIYQYPYTERTRIPNPLFTERGDRLEVVSQQAVEDAINQRLANG
jgi:flavin-binding protein dodecin